MQSGQETKLLNKTADAQKSLSLAQERLKKQDYKWAITFLNKALTFDTDAIDLKLLIHLEIAFASFKLNGINDPLIVNHLTLLQQLHPILKSDLDTVFNKETCEEILKNYSEILKTYVIHKPDLSHITLFEHAYYFSKGVLFAKAFELEKSEANLEKAVNIYPHNSAAWYSYALLYFNMALLPDYGLDYFKYAMTCIDRAEKLAPTKSDYCLLKGEILLAENELSEAVFYLVRGFSLDIIEGTMIDSPIRQMPLLNAYDKAQKSSIKKISQYASTIEEFELFDKQIAESKHEYSDIYFKRATRLISLNRPDLAINDLTLAIWLRLTSLDENQNAEIYTYFNQLCTSLLTQIKTCIKENKLKRIKEYNEQLYRAAQGFIHALFESYSEQPSIDPSLGKQCDLIGELFNKNKLAIAEQEIQKTLICLAEGAIRIPMVAVQHYFLRLLCEYTTLLLITTADKIPQNGSKANHDKALSFYETAKLTDKAYAKHRNFIDKKIANLPKPVLKVTMAEEKAGPSTPIEEKITMQSSLLVPAQTLVPAKELKGEEKINPEALKCLALGQDALKNTKYALAILFFERYLKNAPHLPKRYAIALANIQNKLKQHKGKDDFFSMDLYLLLAQIYWSNDGVENAMTSLNLGLSHGIREGSVIPKPDDVHSIACCYDNTQNILISEVSTTLENCLELKKFETAIEEQKQVSSSPYFERAQFLMSLNQSRLAASDLSFGLWLVFAGLDTNPGCFDEVDFHYSDLAKCLTIQIMEMLKKDQFQYLRSYNLQLINALDGLIGVEEDKAEAIDTTVNSLQIRFFIKDKEFRQAQDAIDDTVLDIAEGQMHFATEAHKLTFMKSFYLLTMEYLIQKGDLAKGPEALRYYTAALNVDSIYDDFESVLKKKISLVETPELIDDRTFYEGDRFFLKGLLFFYDDEGKIENGRILESFLKGFTETICVESSFDVPDEVPDIICAFDETQGAAVQDMLKIPEFAKHSSEFKKMSSCKNEKDRSRFHYQRANLLRSIGKYDLAINDYAFSQWLITMGQQAPPKGRTVEFGSLCTCLFSQVLLSLEKNKLKRLEDYTHFMTRYLRELLLCVDFTSNTELNNSTSKIRNFIRDQSFNHASREIISIIEKFAARKLTLPHIEARTLCLNLIYHYVIENLLFKGDEAKHEIDLSIKDGKEIKADSPQMKKMLLFYQTALGITSYAPEYVATVKAKLQNAQNYIALHEKLPPKEQKENKLEETKIALPITIKVAPQVKTNSSPTFTTKMLKQRMQNKVKPEKKEEKKQEKKEEEEIKVEPISLVKGHSLPEDAVNCLKKLEAHGALRGRAYAVGGMVCETLKPTLSKNPDTDIDLVFGTTENPEEVIKKAFSDCKISSRKDKDSWSFKVILPNQTKVDIWHSTTLAKDALTNEQALLEDAQDRDFTMNALYKNSKNELFDPTKRGVKHLTKGKNGIIRSIVSTDLSFKSDPIRILRAIYFNTKRGSTFTLPMQKTISHIAKDSFSKLVKEQPGKLNSWLLKLFGKHYGLSNLVLMEKLNVLSTILPEVVPLLNDPGSKKIISDTFAEWAHLKPNLNRIYAFLIVLVSNATRKSWDDVRKNNPLFEVNFTGLDEKAVELNKVPWAKFWNTQNYKDEAIKKWGNRFINDPPKSSPAIFFPLTPVIAGDVGPFRDSPLSHLHESRDSFPIITKKGMLSS